MKNDHPHIVRQALSAGSCIAEPRSALRGVAKMLRKKVAYGVPNGVRRYDAAGLHNIFQTSAKGYDMRIVISTLAVGGDANNGNSFNIRSIAAVGVLANSKRSREIFYRLNMSRNLC